MGGTAQKLLYDSVNKAYHDEMRMNEELIEGRFKSIIESSIGLARLNGMRGRKRPIPGFPVTLTDEQYIMALLNIGNEQNLTSLMQYQLSEKGAKLTADDIQTLINNATEEEWRFVQSIWDFLDNEMYPRLNALHQRNAGVPLKKVMAREVITPYGIMRGGYFPLIFDKEMSYAAERQAMENAGNDPFKKGKMGQQKTNAHSTIERQGRTYEDLAPLLSFDVFINSMNENIHDLTHREAVMDINALLRQPGIRMAIDGALGKEYTAQFDTWIKSVANPSKDYQRSGFWAGLRSNISMSAMGMKVSVMLCQPSGFFQGAAKLGTWWTARGIAEYLRNLPRGIRGRIHNCSYELKVRNKTSYERDLAGSIGNGITDRAKQKLAKKMFGPISFIDQIVAEALWYGGYLRGMKEGKGEEGAADYANRVLRVTNPTGAQKDLSLAQRGWNHGDMGKLFTMFGTFFSGTQNLIWEQIALSKSDWNKGNYGQAVFQPARLGFLIAVLPAMFDALIKGGWPDDDDDEAAWEKYFTEVSKGVISYSVGGLPVVRDIVEVALSTFGAGNGYSSGRFTTPAQSSVEAVFRGAKEVHDVFDEDEEFRWQSAVRAIGPLTGLPTSQLVTTAEGVVNFDEDELYDSLWALFTRPPRD